jgi:hypothetical protein
MDSRRVGGTLSDRNKKCLFSLHLQTRHRGPHTMCIGAVSPEDKAKRREADNSPRSSTYAQNGGVIPLLPHMSSWRGAHSSTGTTLQGNFQTEVDLKFVLLSSHLRLLFFGPLRPS